jgi:hypothetical protein
MASFVGNTYIAGGTVNVAGTVPISGSISGGTVSIGGTVPVSVPGTVTTTATRYAYTSVAGTVVGGTVDATIIASPGNGTALYIIEEFAQNPTATAAVVIFKAGTVPYRTLTCQNQGDGLFVVHPAGMERVLPGSALLALNVSAGTVDYAFRYRAVTL